MPRYRDTQPDSVNPFASTAPDVRDLYKRIEAVHARGPLPVERVWEDSGVHGTGRRARLRGTKVRSSRVAERRQDITSPITLPPRPSSRSMTGGEVAVVAAVTVGAAALVYYLWKRRNP
jgi:hypothetical protein